MKPRLYLETSIISYLAALPSRDLIVSAQCHERTVQDVRFMLSRTNMNPRPYLKTSSISHLSATGDNLKLPKQLTNRDNHL